MLGGYRSFRSKYAHGDGSIMQTLSVHGQKPKIMVIACCDSRVDPALILQCDPGDLFIVRNVANIVPPYEKDEAHHGTSAALEFGICYLKVKHLILLGHSQCGGIQALLEHPHKKKDDFITNWVSLIGPLHGNHQNHDDYARAALHRSYENCLEFPWIKKRLSEKKLMVHRWFFDIKTGRIFTYSVRHHTYQPLKEGKSLSKSAV